MRPHTIITRQGVGRSENRDATGYSTNADTSMYAIVDGTAKPASGELARALIDFLETGFRNLDASRLHSIKDAEQTMLNMLGQAKKRLCPDYPVSSVSYLVLLVSGDNVLSIHEGDCCVGVLHGQTLQWLTEPHCHANWRGDLTHEQIAANPARKRLFKCLSHRRAHDPSIQTFAMEPETIWVLATDGFWAGLGPHAQMAAIIEGKLEDHIPEDDLTFMTLKPKSLPVSQ